MSDGARIEYSIAGAPTAPALLFINSIATTRELWARQVPRLSKSFRVITYDARGHGFSQVTAGNYTIEQLGRDALVPHLRAADTSRGVREREAFDSSRRVNAQPHRRDATQ
jgi:pimeloyl-ACP methyl ester carboxylesterase